MHTPHVRPTGVERTFGTDEIIVSKTDTKGVITYANDVFLRVSALPEPDVVGRPHNLIRHPDMPRAVFKLMWDTIQAGEEIFAYVLNLAGDGAHYWVFAHVTPSSDRHGRIVGYHSNRRCPDRDAVAEAQGLYRRLRTAERQASSSPAGLQASTDLLAQVLAERGQTYDELVWTLASSARAAS
ncbi:MAG TPA: PAS domain-containing protein [Nocardioides sp.]|nr:PAS domain-containing protein [Nocardioides sp.]